MRINFSATYFLTDSQVVFAMLQRDSFGFRSYAAVRIDEIQESTDIKDWYWVESGVNIADWTTRGKRPEELGSMSEWVPSSSH